MIIKCVSLIIFYVFILTYSLSSQQSKDAPNWDSWNFLIGDWLGGDGGNPGQGVGSFSFNLDLQKTIPENNVFF